MPSPGPLRSRISTRPSVSWRGSRLVAEKSDHHPEWRNVYKTVEVVLSTHDADGVTKRDVDLARAMNTIAGQLGHS